MSRASIEEIHSAVADSNTPQLFLKLASEHPDLPALHSRKTDAPDSWNTWSIAEFQAWLETTWLALVRSSVPNRHQR